MSKQSSKSQNFKTSIKVGDTVKVIAGKYKGETARVLEVLTAKQRVRLEDVVTIKRHIAPQKNPRHPEGGIIEGQGSVHISNVMLMSEDLGRPVRTGKTFTDGGKKVRIARGRNVKAVEL